MRRILFLGQKKIGEKCFELLLQYSGLELIVAGVVSNSDVARVWWKSNDLFRVAQRLRLPFVSNEKPIMK